MKLNEFRYLVLGLGLIFGNSVLGAERYSATVNDGTPSSVEHSTQMGDAGGDTIQTNIENSRNLRNRSIERAPKTRSSVLDTEIDDLKKQSSNLQHRLAILEEAREEVRANPPILEAARAEVSEPEENLPLLLPVESAPILAAKPKVEPAKKQTPVKKYDTVPVDKIPQFSERLKYTHELLKRYGLAFDYRTTTLQELKTTLATLENSSK
jgi:hypothetical protein